MTIPQQKPRLAGRGEIATAYHSCLNYSMHDECEEPARRPAKGIETERARDALYHLDPGMPIDQWHAAGRAAIAAGLSIDDIDAWSSAAPNYRGRRDVETQFAKVTADGGTTEATLYWMARDAGWQGPSKAMRPTPKPKSPEKTAARPNLAAADFWARCEPATGEHPYIVAKQGRPDGLRKVGAGDTATVAGQSVAGWLVVPCCDIDGHLNTLQFISPEKGGRKLNLPGAPVQGSFVVGAMTDSIKFCESIGTAWSVNTASGDAAVCCFGAGNMAKVAREYRKKHPSAALVIVPDRGKESDAEKIAADVAGTWVAMPAAMPTNYDANDYLLEHGAKALADLLTRPVAPALPLDVVFADELPGSFTPPNEIVEGVLTADDGSVFYGDSNSGKTFFVIDLGCAVARGVPWMGRKTEQGLVIYLAAESPASVKSRLQAYQRHHGVRVPNFAIVQSPIDLFDGDADTDAVIQVVRQLEHQRGQKARLIIGDTLARLSAGANENAGQDMGLVVRRFDRIRSECKAHFCLIHHAGKSAAAGARGWSGVRAAVDTEIEITDSPAGRCAELMKQRDLSTKGVRIGFKLDTVTLGMTKWGSPATSCVVVPADAPDKQAGKRVSEAGGAIMEMLRTRGSGIKKSELVKHFAEHYTSSAIYRQLKKLVEAGQVCDVAGIVAVVGIAGSAK